MKEYQWFFTWLPVRPGSLLAISDHLFPMCGGVRVRVRVRVWV
jgi:hypothetical protein